jgi:hypothetical protein
MSTDSFPRNYNDNKNLSKIVHNRRNYSSDIRKEKFGRANMNDDYNENNEFNNNYNDNEAISKLVTQVPKNSIRPNTGEIEAKIQVENSIK